MVKYSICLATFDDFHGVFFTIQALRMYHDLTDCEIIVLDNNPTSEHGADVRGFINNASADPKLPQIKYFEQEGNSGTSSTRHKLFELAEGELVIVMDCHVLLKEGAITKLKKFWESADETMKKNLFTGPLLMDGMNHHCTHFECEWRAEMWGTWATAWTKDGSYYVAKQSEDKKKVQLRRLMTDKIEYEFTRDWPGHEHALRQLGFELAGWDSDSEPFEIPAQGLGLFIAAKEHWLGFNPHHKHFGGEECYIHEKYRMAGRTTMCLPFMSWNHRFGRPEGPRYPITREGKMRNYVLEFLELGLDLEPIRKHFVEEIKIAQAVWDKCVEDPINFDPYTGWAPNTAPSNIRPKAVSNFGMPLPTQLGDLTGMALEMVGIPRDADRHFNLYMKYGGKCNSILELNKRRETTLFWAAALNHRKCKKGTCQKEACDCESRMLSYNQEADSLLVLIADAVAEKKGRLAAFEHRPYKVGQELPALDETYDLLYLNEDNSFKRIGDILAMYSDNINKYIVLRGAIAGHAGMKGEDGQEPGMFHAIKMFIKNNPEWFIVEHSQEQYGFTVLSKVQDERPETPIVIWPKSDDKGGPCGAGQELKAILKKLGIESSPSCGCNAFALQMDNDGPDACEARIEEIVDYLKTQADSRNLGAFFVRSAVRFAVQRAIKTARKKIAKGECS